LFWDPKSETFSRNKAARKLLSPKYRKPWKLDV